MNVGYRGRKKFSPPPQLLRRKRKRTSKKRRGVREGGRERRNPNTRLVSSLGGQGRGGRETSQKTQTRKGVGGGYDLSYSTLQTGLAVGRRERRGRVTTGPNSNSLLFLKNHYFVLFPFWMFFTNVFLFLPLVLAFFCFHFLRFSFHFIRSLLILNFSSFFHFIFIFEVSWRRVLCST